MSDPGDQSVPDMAREFAARLRARIAQQASGPPDELAERLLGTGAAVAAAVVVFIPTKRKDGLAAALLHAALRYYGVRPPLRPEVIDG